MAASRCERRSDSAPRSRSGSAQLRLDARLSLLPTMARSRPNAQLTTKDTRGHEVLVVLSVLCGESSAALRRSHIRWWTWSNLLSQYTDDERLGNGESGATARGFQSRPWRVRSGRTVGQRALRSNEHRRFDESGRGGGWRDRIKSNRSRSTKRTRRRTAGTIRCAGGFAGAPSSPRERPNPRA